MQKQNESIYRHTVHEGKDNGHGLTLTILGDTHTNNGDHDNDHGNLNRKLLQNDDDNSYFQPFTGCFDSQWNYISLMLIGCVVDTNANQVYRYQLNVRLVLGSVYIGAAYSGSFTYSPALIDSSTDISTRLTQMNVWREEYYNEYEDTNGLWHLLTNNHPPAGTVGIAYLRVICSYGYGTGVTNYIWYSPGTWEVWAHEIGHNFGGEHAFDEGSGVTGGIMVCTNYFIVSLISFSSL